MITIHNSSLTFNRTGYIRPEQASLDKKQTLALVADGQSSIEQGISASTPEQVQAAIAKSGLSKEQNLPKEYDRRTNIALQAYNQTRNQPIQVQLESLINSVDLYA
ncbi:MAG: hypothetical protein PHH11_15475 [Methylomonas sp.]|nr:hypothetical protein [Methylomonas sp.]